MNNIDNTTQQFEKFWLDTAGDVTVFNLPTSVLESIKHIAKLSWIASSQLSNQQWIPIESAPKDGAYILARNAGYGVRETFWRLYGEGSVGKKYFDDGIGPSGYWDWPEPQSNWGSSWLPTHWMPLPSPPST